MNNGLTKESQAATYSCRLVYFIILSFDIYYLYLYQTPLTSSIYMLFFYFLLVSSNLYLFLTCGQNPGFASSQKQQQGQQFSGTVNGQVCELCMCKKKLRMKHCYECGRCVYKYDHHCTWIGGCVGEFNHGKFWVFCLFQTFQAVTTLWIKYSQAIGNYKYREGEQYNGAYGAIVVMIIIMVLYVLFVGGMLAFHTYLIFFNTTTYQTTKFTKLPYMKKTLYPFYEGIFKNLSHVFCHSKQIPIQWNLKSENISKLFASPDVCPQELTISDIIKTNTEF